MNKSYSLDKWSEILFYLGFINYLIFKFGIFNYRFNNILTVIAVFFLSISIIISKYSLKEVLLLLFLITLGLVVIVYANEWNLLFIILLVYAGRNSNIDNVIKIMFTVYFLYFIFMFFQNMIGTYDSSFALKFIDGSAMIVKDYGFGHPNQISSRYISWILMFFFLRRDNYRFKYVVLSSLGELFVYKISLSRTGLIIFLLVILMYVFLSKINISKFIADVSIMSFVIINIISLALPYLYVRGNMVAQFLDTLFTGRIRLAAKFLNNYGVRIFPQNLSFLGKDDVLDSLIPYILLSYGLLVYITILFLCFSFFKFCLRKQTYIPISFFVIFFVIGMMELVAINPSYNFTIFFFIMLFKQNSVNYADNS